MITKKKKKSNVASDQLRYGQLIFGKLANEMGNNKDQAYESIAQNSPRLQHTQKKEKTTIQNHTILKKFNLKNLISLSPISTQNQSNHKLAADASQDVSKSQAISKEIIQLDTEHSFSANQYYHEVFSKKGALNLKPNAVSLNTLQQQISIENQQLKKNSNNYNNGCPGQKPQQQQLPLPYQQQVGFTVKGHNGGDVSGQHNKNSLSIVQQTQNQRYYTSVKRKVPPLDLNSIDSIRTFFNLQQQSSQTQQPKCFQHSQQQQVAQLKMIVKKEAQQPNLKVIKQEKQQLSSEERSNNNKNASVIGEPAENKKTRHFKALSHYTNLAPQYDLLPNLLLRLDPRSTESKPSIVISQNGDKQGKSPAPQQQKPQQHQMNRIHFRPQVLHQINSLIKPLNLQKLRVISSLSTYNKNSTSSCSANAVEFLLHSPHPQDSSTLSNYQFGKTNNNIQFVNISKTLKLQCQTNGEFLFEKPSKRIIKLIKKYQYDKEQISRHMQIQRQEFFNQDQQLKLSPSIIANAISHDKGGGTPSEQNQSQFNFFQLKQYYQKKYGNLNNKNKEGGSNGQGHINPFVDKSYSITPNGKLNNGKPNNNITPFGLTQGQNNHQCTVFNVNNQNLNQEDAEAEVVLKPWEISPEEQVNNDICKNDLDLNNNMNEYADQIEGPEQENTSAQNLENYVNIELQQQALQPQNPNQ